MSGDVRSSQELLPWAVPITDRLVACKDSSFLATFEFQGADADTVGEADVYQVGQAADRMLSALRDLPVTIWWTVRRERTEDYPGEPMPDEISQMLDDDNREQFMSNAGLVNRHFLSVIWMPERNTASVFRKAGMLMAEGANVFKAAHFAIASTYFGQESFAWKAAELESAIVDFEAKLSQVEDILSSLQARRLGGQEFLGFLWAQANPGKRMKPKAWDGRTLLDAYLPERPITVYGDMMQFGDTSDDMVFATLTSMKSWPDSLAFGAFNALTSLGCEMVISHCFRVMDTAASQKHIKSVKRINEVLKYSLQTWLVGTLLKGGQLNENNADPARAQAAEEAKEALGELNAGNLIFGYHNISIMLIHNDEHVVAEMTRQMTRMFNASPFVGTVRESIGMVSAWATTLPGQWQECSRWLTLSSANMVDCAPLLGVASGQRMNHHLTEQLGRPCQALTVLPTDNNTPFYFNFHSGALGHTLVVGPSRTGKSIGMNFLISQFRKYGDAANIIIFDKDYSCRIPTLLQHGQHVDLQLSSTVKINPMAMAKYEDCIPWLITWVEGLIASRGYAVTSEDIKAIAVAVTGTASNPSPHMHRLRTVRTMLPMHLGVHLDQWVNTGQFSAYFDNEEDSFDLGSFTCLEMGEIMKEPRVARAFMEYAFFRLMRSLKEQLTGEMKVTMVYVEECWFLLEDEVFAARLKDWLKTFAKLNAFVVLTTQSAEDLEELPPSIFASIRDNIQTRIFLPNANILTEKLTNFYRRNFDLRPDLIQRIGTAIPKRDYIVVQPDVSRKVCISLSERQVSALRSDMPAQRIFNEVYAKKGPGWELEYIEAMLRHNRKSKESELV